MRIWEIKLTDKGYIIVPAQEMYCPLCGGELLLHDFRALWGGDKEFYHADIHLKCSRCGLLLTFGVPISEEEYRLLRNSQLHARTIRFELSEIYEKLDQTVSKKLEKWGYW